MNYAAALTRETHAALVAHLLQHRRDEDVCFALYRPSRGRTRVTGLIVEPILPRDGERRVHGNASVRATYFERALGLALAAGAGLAFLHSHTRRSRGWQEMSRDDLDTERLYAPRALAMTDLPLLGLTLAGNEFWSARVWEKSGRGEYARRDCESVRVVGERLAMSFHPGLRPAPGFREELSRTVSAWGGEAQADLARLHIGVVGLGNVGALVAEALVRSGVAWLTLIDFDTVKLVNLDRLLNATLRDAELVRSKVEVAQAALRAHATAAEPRIDAFEWSIVEEQGFRAALDCDVLFCCVDRPWPRAVLNFAAYAHLLPVVDGGIRVRTNDGRMRSADWKAHVATPGRRCLECLEQVNPAFVTLERQGDLDDPSYIDSLPGDHPLRSNENVFAFGMAAASLELMQLLQMIVAPGGVADVGSQHYNLKTGLIDLETRGCEPGCLYSERLLGVGEDAGVSPLGAHPAAQREREARQTARVQQARLPGSRPDARDRPRRLPRLLSRLLRSRRRG
jgi:molybdopterin/thiamine biosynthesis adenylyltransferase